MAGTFVGQAWVQISPSLSGFQKQVSKDIVAPMQKTGEQAGQAIATGTEKSKPSFARMASAVASAFAVQRVISFGRSVVTAASQARVANKDLTVAFQNAGDSTGTFATHAIKLAESLGRTIGVQPTVIKQAEGILATFHNVSNATAFQAGIFDRATKAAADLAAAGFGNMEGNAKALGKALEDPIKFMGTLRRSGITLTQSQQDNIKAMQQQGNLLGAQKLLLSAVEARVGGMAAATATGGQKASVAFEEMKVSLGQALLPAVGAVMAKFSVFFGFIADHSAVFTPILIALGVFAALMGVINIVNTIAALTINGVTIGTIAATAATWLWNAALTVWNVLMSPVTLVILAVVAAIALLVAIVILIWKNWSTIWNAIAAAALWVWNTVLQPVFSAIAAAWGAMVNAIAWFWNTILYPVIKAVWTVVSILLRIYIAPILLAIWLAWQAMSLAIRFFWNTILQPTFTAVAAAAGWLWNTILRPVFAAISAGWRALGAAIGWVWANVIRPTWTGLQAAVSWMWNGVLRPIFSGISAGWRALGNGIAAVYHTVIVPIFNALKTAVGLVRQAFEGAKTGIARAWDGVRDAVKKPVKWVVDVIINKFITGVNAIISVFGIKKIGTINTSKWAEGGQIPAPRSGPARGDVVPALLEPGEWVLTRRQARAIGYQNLRNLPRYQSGGPVGRQMAGGFGALVDPWAGIDMRSWLHYVNPLNAARSVGHLASAGFGALANFAGDIYDATTHLLRHGAAAAFEEGLKPLKALINHIPLGKTGWAQDIKKGVLWIMDRAVDWVRGHEEADDPAVGGMAIDDIAKQVINRFPQLRITSGYRPGDPGYHGKNLARDLGGPQGVMDRAAGWIQDTLRTALLEGIHQTADHRAALSVKNGKIVKPSFWGPGTWANHINHIHIASQAGPGASGDLQTYAQSLVNQKWPGQFPFFSWIVTHESGWNPKAKNAKSGAYGLGQALPASKIDRFGNRDDGRAQIRWMIDYIAGRYGNPLSAKIFWEHNHWYAQGGRIPGYGGGDIFPAMLEPGEWVLTRRQAKAIGYDRLASLPRFQAGGFVSAERAQIRIPLSEPVRPAPVVGPADEQAITRSAAMGAGAADNRVVALLRRIAQGIEAGQTVVIDGRQVARVVNREMAWVG